MIKVYWDDPNRTIIRLDFYEPIASWHEYRTAFNQVNYMVDQVSQSCYVIVNAGDAKMPRFSTRNPLDELAITRKLLPANVIGMVSVILQKPEQHITQLMAQIEPSTPTIWFETVTTVDDAYTMIEADKNEQSSVVRY